MTRITKLPEPQKNLEFPLMRAIEMRRTKRRWEASSLSYQEISNILWVACGVTHKETKRSKCRRTAPSACNSQEIKVYIAIHNGLYLYDEKNHWLVKVLTEDIRKYIGSQRMMQSAPVGLIYVSDYSKMSSFIFRDDTRRWYTSTADTGFISQNVYLYCAAANLSTAVISIVDREKLHSLMGLNKSERVVYTQVIGRSIP